MTSLTQTLSKVPNGKIRSKDDSQGNKYPGYLFIIEFLPTRSISSALRPVGYEINKST